jgi:hypothetical protein
MGFFEDQIKVLFNLSYFRPGRQNIEYAGQWWNSPSVYNLCPWRGLA